MLGMLTGAAGGGGYSASSEAKSGNETDVTANQKGGSESAGNRGTQFNVVFPGGTLNNDQGINPSVKAAGSIWLPAAIAIGVLFALPLLKKL